MTTMNEQQQELNERIADDERHAATMRKARDYDALLANANADGDQGMTERQIVELSRVYLALIEAHGLNIEAARNVIDRALKQAAAVLKIFGSAEAAARFEGNDTSARAKAAEAEVVDLHRQLAEMAAAMEEIEDERLALLARVAELESQLAAQGWQPGSETPKHDWYLVYDFSEDDQPLFRYYGPTGWRLSGDRVIPNWYMPIPPLPPAPQETE